MKLIFVHQILIGAALGLAVLFGIRSLLLFARGGAATNLILCIAAIAIALALAFYLRKVRAQRLSGRETMSLR